MLRWEVPLRAAAATRALRHESALRTIEIAIDRYERTERMPLRLGDDQTIACRPSSRRTPQSRQEQNDIDDIFYVDLLHPFLIHEQTATIVRYPDAVYPRGYEVAVLTSKKI